MAATYCFDTGAPVKRYHRDSGTAHLDTVFGEPDATFIIARVAIAELPSALARKHAGGEISRPTLPHALSQFFEDLIADVWILDIEHQHIHGAQQSILR